MNQSSEEQYPQSETQSSAGNDARDTINTTSQIQHVPRREGEELRAALEAQDRAERLDEEYQELVAQADGEGWDEQTGGSHLTSAWKPVAEAYAQAREARRAALSLPQPGGWRPISEAPSGQRETLLLTDGRAVLLGGRSWVCTGEQTPDGFWHTQSGSGWNPNFSFTPTHWQPLPPVPTDGGKQDNTVSVDESGVRPSARTAALRSAGGREP